MTVNDEQGQENEVVEGGRTVKSGDIGVVGCCPEYSPLLLVLIDTPDSSIVSDRLVRTRASRRFIFALINRRKQI